jgi:hypothetical protein
MAPPVGRRGDLEPVLTAPCIRERLDAIGGVAVFGGTATVAAPGG